MGKKKKARRREAALRRETDAFQRWGMVVGGAVGFGLWLWVIVPLLRELPADIVVATIVMSIVGFIASIYGLGTAGGKVALRYLRQRREDESFYRDKDR